MMLKMTLAYRDTQHYNLYRFRASGTEREYAKRLVKKYLEAETKEGFYPSRCCSILPSRVEPKLIEIQVRIELFAPAMRPKSPNSFLLPRSARLGQYRLSAWMHPSRLETESYARPPLPNLPPTTELGIAAIRMEFRSKIQLALRALAARKQCGVGPSKACGV